MAQEVRVHLWCDRHRQDGVNVDGATYRITLEGVEYEAELCVDCAAELVDPLALVLEECGRRQGRAPKVDVSGFVGEDTSGRRKVECPVCFAEVQAHSLNNHCKARHGEGIQLIQHRLGVEVVGVRPTVLERELAEATAEPRGGLPCKYDDCDRRFASAQGRSTHYTRVHGETPVRRRAS